MKAETIIANAREATGLHDLGDPAVVEALEQLVEASNTEARLSEVGAQRWEANLTATLARRLKVVDYIKQHPDVLETPVEKPLFVFGLPRTGTTVTINLLAADPKHRAYLRWEGQNPAPPAAPGALRSDPRYQEEVAKLEMALKYMPQIAAVHFEEADGPTEDQFAMNMSFRAQLFESIVSIPSYTKWMLGTSYLPAFQFQKQLLQMLQSTNGGRWTLKNPWHPLYLNDLTTVFPDARLVMTHRDPVEVVGSSCSLIRHTRPMFSDQVDLREIGEQMMATFDNMIARQNAYRDRHGEDAIYDIQYEDQIRDPIGEMRKLYAHFDEPFTDEAEAAMRKLLAEQPQHKHGKHVYSLEEFGLTADVVRERYKDYVARFKIPQKG